MRTDHADYGGRGLTAWVKSRTGPDPWRRVPGVLGLLIVWLVLMLAAWPGVSAVGRRVSAPTTPMAKATPIECVANFIASATSPGESVRFSTQSGTFALPGNLVIAEQVEALI